MWSFSHYIIYKNALFFSLKQKRKIMKSYKCFCFGNAFMFEENCFPWRAVEFMREENQKYCHRSLDITDKILSSINNELSSIYVGNVFPVFSSFLFVFCITSIYYSTHDCKLYVYSENVILECYKYECVFCMLICT